MYTNGKSIRSRICSGSYRTRSRRRSGDRKKRRGKRLMRSKDLRRSCSETDRRWLSEKPRNVKKPLIK